MTTRTATHTKHQTNDLIQRAFVRSLNVQSIIRILGIIVLFKVREGSKLASIIAKLLI